MAEQASNAALLQQRQREAAEQGVRVAETPSVPASRNARAALERQARSHLL